jgi:hypothetical protein
MLQYQSFLGIQSRFALAFLTRRLEIFCPKEVSHKFTVVTQQHNHPSPWPAIVRAAFLVLYICFCRRPFAQNVEAGAGSKLTGTRLKAAGWWPTKGDRSGDDYVGTAACVRCHTSQGKVFPETGMARAAVSAPDAASLRENPHLGFEIGSYRYQIDSSAQSNILKVSSRGSSLSANLLWAFGMGRIGQTYVYKEKDQYYESHLTFYSGTHSLDITPGHTRSTPLNLEQAAGRHISSDETHRCFGCHTTASTIKNRFSPQTMFLGVTCEACHGPGADHVAAASSGNNELITASIMNPARLTPVESVDFCGACHRTWQDVVSDGPTRTGMLNIRFAPYRLENSQCWKKGGGRITCMMCHDPHRPLSLDPESYDSPCLQCHLAADAKRSGDDQRTACTVGVKLCVTCHMAKFRNSALHTAFTDHWIRIAEPGAAMPD